MRRERIIHIEELRQTDEGTEVLVTSVVYTQGGINYTTYNRDARGYYLRVHPETRHRNGVVSYFMFSGTRALIEPAKAFSAKRLAAIVPDPELVAKLRAHVLAKSDEHTTLLGSRGQTEIAG